MAVKVRWETPEGNVNMDVIELAENWYINPDNELSVYKSGPSGEEDKELATYARGRWIAVFR